MSNRPSRRSSGSKSNSRSPVVLALVGLAAVGVIAVVIALLAGGGDDGADGVVDSGPAKIPSGNPSQVSDVEIVGTPLPRFDAAIVPDPAIGTKAPLVVAEHFDGSESSIDFADGQERIIVFLAHWCPHCQAEVRLLRSWFETGEIDPGIDLVAVSTAVDRGAPNYPPSDWFLRERWSSPVIRDSNDSDLATAFGLSSYPYMVILDGEGNVTDRRVGSIPPELWDSLLTGR